MDAKIMVEKDNKTNEKEAATHMATQIAATPVIKGSEALKILKEANRKPSNKSEKGAKKLANIFDKMME